MSIFSKVAKTKTAHSTFNMSYERKFSMDMGYLVPCHVQEVVPGDNITMNTSQILRMQPMLAPIMHEVNITVHHFFVPNRILWKDWEDFITGGESGLDTTLFPMVEGLECQTQSLADYLGLPITDYMGSGSALPPVSVLPFLAYNRIYNDYYRQEWIQDKLPVTPINGVATPGDYTAQDPDFFNLRKRAWGHDYFTSCLPAAQKGNPVTIPLVNGGVAGVDWEYNQPDKIYSTEQFLDGYHNTEGFFSSEFDRKGTLTTDTGGAHADSSIDNSANLSVNLEDIQAEAATINDLRNAFSLQRWLEKNARAGSRYIESILAHFGVRSSDARLQRPEYLGGSMSPIFVSEVVQTAQTLTASTPQGNMAGHGLNVGKGNAFKKFIEEHGYIISVCSVMPRTAYQQGIPRHWSKSDKFDYFWPTFENIGEQAVLNKELYVQNSSDDDEVFGYIPRYAEYKFNPSTVHGDFKTSLNYWHLGRIFDNQPMLNSEFIESNPRNDIFAVVESTEGHLLVDMYHSIHAKRKMQYFGEPGLTRL